MLWQMLKIGPQAKELDTDLHEMVLPVAGLYVLNTLADAEAADP